MDIEIEVGEYVRTREGHLGKLIEINEQDYNYLVIDIAREIRNDEFPETHLYLKNEDIKKHSKDIIDLIEVGDMLELKEGNDIAYVGLKQDTITVSYKELLESIEKGECKLLSILTHEQYEQNCYKLEE